MAQYSHLLTIYLQSSDYMVDQGDQPYKIEICRPQPKNMHFESENMHFFLKTANNDFKLTNRAFLQETT